MKVLTVDRSNWDTPGPYPKIVEVTIENICLKCGGPRGEPYLYIFHEDGGSYACHKWDNPCGHIDYYDEVLKEAEKSQKRSNQ